MQSCRPSAPLLSALILVSLTLILVTGAWAAPKEHILHVFNSKDGAYPEAGLVMDAAGNLYGTTWAGGDTNCSYYGCGVVFELSPASNGKWIEKILHQFHGPDGAYPDANLIFDAAGNLYGTTSYGGENECASYGGGQPTCGVVFELSRGSDSLWTETVLHRFHGKDGAFPFASLSFDAAGKLFGTTRNGGNPGCGASCGVVFELSRSSGGDWVERVLHRFDYTDGAWPWAGLVFGASNTLYGTASSGGEVGGVIFELKAGSNGRWTENVLYEFNPNHGLGEYGPYCSLTLDAAGNLYGTTMFSGSAFQLTRDSNGKWTETEISDLAGGLYPQGALAFDPHGNLYGTTEQGGKGLCAESGCGIVFKLIPHANGSWSTEVLHEFNDGNGDGIEPDAGVIFDGAGNLYGTTSGGGPLGQAGYGVVFEITP
jgi:uncharacterized repeat protein (TIGR03803 family)